MSDQPIGLHRGGPPETVLPAEPADLLAELEAALADPDLDARRAVLRGLAERRPRSMAVWAALGECSRDRIEAYAYFRVGYHRGLDQLRQAGWRGSGYVRRSHPENRGFLDALAGLGAAAAAIGADAAAPRCAHFLNQLDPSAYSYPPE